MPDYGGPSGFGGSGGGEAATGGMGPGQGSGYGGNQSGQHHGGMSQATKAALAAMAETDVSNTDAEVEKTRLAADRFAVRMQQEADVNNPIIYSDALRLHNVLTTQNINPNQVSLKNFEQGPFAQKNVVMHNQQRIAQFGEMPTFGIAGMLSRFADIDTRGLVLSPSLSGELDRGGGGDLPSTMELLYPTEETLSEEEIEAAEDPTIGYALDYYDQIQPYTTLAAGGLASLPANFNPMTGINPFRMMMRGGRI